MDYIKEAFFKVKQDIYLLQEELRFMQRDLNEFKKLMGDLISVSKQALVEIEGKRLKYKEGIPTQVQERPTDNVFIPAEKMVFNPLKHQNKPISTGNEGVPTDRQTNQQTNQQTDFPSINQQIAAQKGFSPINQQIAAQKGFSPINQQTAIQAGFSPLPADKPTNRQTNQEEIISLAKKDSFKEAVGMLESLDNIKKELRLKFKRLTDQEVLVFSCLYQIEEEQGYADYRAISTKLNLTESSIRDYIGKLIKKGIPVDKIKINNKSIQLKISPDLKKIANLSTILLLRDI